MVEVSTLQIPVDAFQYNGHYYYLYKSVADTWENAKTFCENRGGYLASINDANENTALFNYMNSKGSSYAHFGLSDKDEEGNWTWANGDSLTYVNWGGSEPNGGKSENYAQFFFSNGGWNDSSWKGTFICEWELPDGLNLNSAGNTLNAGKKFKSGEIDLANYPQVTNFNASKLKTAIKITGTSSDNTILGGSKKDSIYGGDGNDSLVGNAGNDIIFGETGDDTLIGGAGNDTLSGGAGNDVFVYTGGNDTIVDYQAKKDSIYMDGNAITGWQVDGKNIIFTTDSGTITVKNGKGKKIMITTAKTYNSSSSDLFEENNFATSANISDITDIKIVGEFENYTEKISTENLITFAK